MSLNLGPKTALLRVGAILIPGRYSYRGQKLQQVAQGCELEFEVVERSEPGFAVLPRRWVVERTFAWLGKHRRLSKDYERLPQMSECFVYQAMTSLMLKRLAS